MDEDVTSQDSIKIGDFGTFIGEYIHSIGTPYLIITNNHHHDEYFTERFFIISDYLDSLCIFFNRPINLNLMLANDHEFMTNFTIANAKAKLRLFLSEVHRKTGLDDLLYINPTFTHVNTNAFMHSVVNEQDKNVIAKLGIIQRQSALEKLTEYILDIHKLIRTIDYLNYKEVF